MTSTSNQSAVSQVGGFAINNTFAQSKFFQKRINRAAVKIQALCRAFLVQARVFRQLKLDPSRQELLDCESRKAEELRRVQEQKEAEWKNLPESVKMEFEESEAYIECLKRDIEDYKKVNDELKHEHKELKKKSKEPHKEADQHNAAQFKVEVANNKLSKENAGLAEEVEKYGYAIEGRNDRKQEFEENLMKEVQQKQILKKYINKVLKLVEDRAFGGEDDESDHDTKKKQVSRSNSPGRIKSSASNKVRHNTKKEASKPKMKGHASFDWTAHASHDWTKNPIEMSETGASDSEEKPEETEKSGGDSMGDLNMIGLHLEPESEKSEKSGSAGSTSQMSFLMDHGMTIDEEQEINNNTKSKNTIAKTKTKVKSRRGSNVVDEQFGASFNWATQSYNWTNRSLDNADDPKIPTHSSTHSSKSHSNRRSSHITKSSTKQSTRKSGKSRCMGDKELLELLEELKDLKNDLKQ